MKRIIKRSLIVLLAILVLVQMPFIYRRYQTGRLAGKIAELNAQRTSREDPKFKEYKGVIHVHTSLGGHSTAGFDELIAAANANDLDFVLMTEHYSDTYDTSALTLNGLYGKTLFVGGNEIDTADGDRFLMIPGSAEAAGLRNIPTGAVLEKLHAENRLALVTYPEKFKSWDSNFDGIEVFSLHTESKKANPLTALFDLIWSYPSYPELTLMSYFHRPDANLQKFDEIAAKRKVSLFAGTDAHSNIGFHLFGDDAGNSLINIKLDPFESTFRIVRAHVLLEKDKPLSRDNLIEAMRAGRYFVSFDVLGDATGFSFTAEDAGGKYYPGEEVGPSTGTRLLAEAPVFGHFAFFKNGEKFLDTRGDSVYYLNYAVDARGPGTYRVEVYLPELGSPFDKMPWIISNPIYVR